jgi:hypothetical protein
MQELIGLIVLTLLV